MTPAMQSIPRLEAGEVGYIVTGIKDVSEVRVGDTFTHVRGGATQPLPGYLEVKPMVFAGLFPTDADGYRDLRDALEKLSLNDASLVYESAGYTASRSPRPPISRVESLDPDNAQARLGLALLSLLKGDFEAGWARHDARFKMSSWAGSPEILATDVARRGEHRGQNHPDPCR